VSHAWRGACLTEVRIDHPTAAAVVACVCLAGPAAAENLLAGRAPIRAAGVLHPERLVDGVLAPGGAAWNGADAAELDPAAVVDWDLGAVQPIAGVCLQADNNDQYLISTSLDGVSWRPLWSSGTRDEPGLQTRLALLSARARWVRLTAGEGDGRFSVAELELHSSAPGLLVAQLTRWTPSDRLGVTWGLGVLAAGAALLAARRWPRAAAAALAALGGTLAWQTLEARAGVTPEQLAWLRACLAALALLAVLAGLGRGSPRWPRLGVLGFCAVGAALCFGNLARPQFHDAGRGQPTFLHLYDMRTYYPMAKYLDELGYDGVYAASAAAVAEDRGLRAIGAGELRDLRTQELTTVLDVSSHLDEVRARFTAERWAAFTADLRYFRDGMGERGFLGSMSDHGGNATPVWFTLAALLFRWTPASDAALWLAVCLDVALLLAAFLALGRAFGAEAALVSLTVFGATDFYLFGSNWFGAGLRHDWLALWCLGVAALKLERFRLGGALLAWSALIRAFPALSLLLVLVPPAWAAAGEVLRTRRLDRRAFAVRHANSLQVLRGAAVASAALLLVSSAAFGPGAWLAWFKKVSMLNAANHVNNLAVKTHVTQTPLQWALVAVAVTALVVLAARKRPPHEAAVLGVLLLPVVFNPANYYLHVVCLVAVLGRPRGAGVVPWVALLGMCAASYFTISGDLDRHFRLDTWVLLGGLGVVLAAALLGDLARRLRAAGDAATTAGGPGQRPVATGCV